MPPAAPSSCARGAPRRASRARRRVLRGRAARGRRHLRRDGPGRCGNLHRHGRRDRNTRRLVPRVRGLPRRRFPAPPGVARTAACGDAGARGKIARGDSEVGRDRLARGSPGAAGSRRSRGRESPAPRAPFDLGGFPASPRFLRAFPRGRDRRVRRPRRGSSRLPAARCCTRRAARRKRSMLVAAGCRRRSCVPSMAMSAASPSSARESCSGSWAYCWRRRTAPTPGRARPRRCSKFHPPVSAPSISATAPAPRGCGGGAATASWSPWGAPTGRSRASPPMPASRHASARLVAVRGGRRRPALGGERRGPRVGSVDVAQGDGRAAVAKAGVQHRVLRHLHPRGHVARERLGGHQDRAGRLGAAGLISTRRRAGRSRGRACTRGSGNSGSPRGRARDPRWRSGRSRSSSAGRPPACRRRRRGSRRRNVDAEPLAFGADDGERAHDRVDQLLAIGHRERVAQPGEDERVDPLAVGGAANVAGEGGRHVGGESGHQLREAREIAVVGHGERESGNWNGWTLASEMSTDVE